MKKPNEPLHSKPFPIYIGLQEQLYEHWVLVQDEFGWNPFILTVWALLHSSTSERKQLIFYGFIGAIDDGFLTNQGTRSILIIL